MNDSLIKSVTQLKTFLEGTKQLDLSLRDASIDKKYKFIDETVDRLKYKYLSKKKKKVVIRYLKKFTGYKPSQLYQLISRAKEGDLKHKVYIRNNPNIIYKSTDIKLLEQTDLVHRRLNSLATKEILRREYELYGNKDFARISNISASHINNLRKTGIYKSHWQNRTKSVVSDIGTTQKPENFCMPGSIRVDTVHQRGIYYIDAVDEITQWQAVICVAKIDGDHMEKAIRILIDIFPFNIFNFHSDKGFEYINRQVAWELTTQLIKHTKSRSYHCNDNALIESKNGSVIRKNMGHGYIHKEMADNVDKFCRNYLNPYLNFHRPCVYMVKIIIKLDGKRKPVYGGAMTPYNKLKQISKIQNKNFLKSNITFDELDIIEKQHSDNQFAKIVREQQSTLFEKIRKYRKIKAAINTKI